ncbi:MAG: DUF4271 domain-containing protein [Bacteroidales bacterium]|jgi:hypothetical protein
MSLSVRFISLLQDSAKTGSFQGIDSLPKSTEGITESRTEEEVDAADTTTNEIQKTDSLVEQAKKPLTVKPVATVKTTVIPADTSASDEQAIKTVKKPGKFERYYLFKDKKDTFVYRPFGIFRTQREDTLQEARHIQFLPYERQHSKFHWTLIIGFISIFIFIVLKTYYQKAMVQVMNTLVNFQISEKMLREKNIIVRRAFLFLNLNFILIFSLFVLLVVRLLGFQIHENYFQSYILITAGVVIILLARMILLYLTGILFNSLSVVTEYIHNIYLINKNLGIILLPLVFISLYSSPPISKIILIMGVIMICIATIFKYLRGLQIIIKNDVLKFYSFLYLCTLELLPVVVSLKIIITLR